MDFENMLNKLKNKDEWNISSGAHKVGILRKENNLHYLYFDKRYTFSIVFIIISYIIADIQHKKVSNK